MRWFGKAVPLISMGKDTVKQPVHVSVCLLLYADTVYCYCHDSDMPQSVTNLTYSPQVVDVAKAIISAIKDPDANGKTYALVG